MNEPTNTTEAQLEVVEQWRPIDGYEGHYEVSSCGRVRSIPRTTRNGRRRVGRVLRICGKMIYRYAVLAKNGVNTTRRICILVCRAFNGPKPTEFHQVNHKDGNKHNDASDNLEWSTATRNQQHACEMNLRPLGELSYQAKLTNEDVRNIRNLYSAGGFTHKKLSERFNVSKSAITNILTNKNWKYIR